jgi:hypothetical protein
MIKDVCIECINKNFPFLSYSFMFIIVAVVSYYLLNLLNKTKKTDHSLNGAITIAIAFVTLFFAYSQLEHIKREINSNTYNSMNSWYNELYKEFPNTFRGISCEDKNSEICKGNLARRYFNLWQNELRHCLTQTIDSDVMDIINHGACRNMIDYPELKEEYKKLKEKGAFYPDKRLRRQISIIIDYSNRSDCESIPNTEDCLIK